MKRIFTTTLRLNTDNEEDRRAWSYLQKLDRKKYRSYNKAIVAAVNDYFGRQEKLENDPYLETREKEDAFMQKIMDTISSTLRFMPMPYAVAMQPAETPKPTEVQMDDDDLATALDFIDSF